MKSRSQAIYGATAQRITNKRTGVQTVSVSRPFSGVDSLSVMADQLHGDHQTIYQHTFSKVRSKAIEGFLYREDSLEILEQTGYLRDPTGIWTSPDASSLYNSVLGDMYDKLRSGEVGSGLDLAVDLAEASQSRRMIKEAFKVVNFVRRFHPRQWANRWLEYQYGWKPLLSSVYDTGKAMMNRRTYSLQRIEGKARLSSDTFGSEGKDTPLAGLVTYYNHRERIRARMVCEFELSNSIKQRLGGYTSLNPLTVAWEIVPYSFVVDWFLDIGGYLRNMESALAYGQKSFRRGYVVYGFMAERTYDLVTYNSKPAGGLTVYGNGGGAERRTYKNRVPLGVYPIPTIPSFRTSLGWQRLVSAASLLSQHVDGYSVWKRRGELLPDSPTRRAWVDPRLRHGLHDLLVDVRLGYRNKP